MEEKAIQIVRALRRAGFEAVFAGGCFRYILLGETSSDIDIATNAPPRIIEALFEKTVPVGKAFGVMLVIIDGGKFEVATFRKDDKYLDGRHPETVSFATMEEDALRRDFTINGIFFDPLEKKIIDFVGGGKDIEGNLIRAIGDPERRFADDKLRMMRAVRFAARFGFKIDEGTFSAIKSHAGEIKEIPVERVAEEFVKILRAGNPRKYFNLLFETRLIDFVLPEVKALKGLNQPEEFHPEGDVLEHTIQVLENIYPGASDELLMGALLHDIGKPATFKTAERIRFDGHDRKGVEIAQVLLKRLRFSGDFIDRVLSLIGSHMRFMHVKDMKLSTFKRFISIPFFDEHIALHRADCLACHKSLDNLEFVQQKRDALPPETIRPAPLITGKDLIEMGLTPGPVFKEILSAVEERQLEGLLKDRDEALSFVKKIVQSKK